VPGTYEVQVYSMMRFGDGYANDELVIPKRAFYAPDDFWSSVGFGKGQLVTIPEIEFNDTLMVGYLKLDETTSGPLVITPDDLENHDSLKIYYASYNPYDSGNVMGLLFAEDLAVLSNITEAVDVYPDSFRPKLE